MFMHIVLCCYLLPAFYCEAVCWGGGGSLVVFIGNKRAPGPLMRQGKDTKPPPKNRREGPGIPFGVVSPLSWKPIHRSVCLTVVPPLYTAEEGCNNKIRLMFVLGRLAGQIIDQSDSDSPLVFMKVNLKEM